MYLPDLPPTVRSFTYPLKQIKVEDIKWLFTDPNQIWTLPSEEGDTYTDGNRMLQHNQQKQTVVYRDLRAEPQPSSAAIELEILNQFMKTHKGGRAPILTGGKGRPHPPLHFPPDGRRAWFTGPGGRQGRGAARHDPLKVSSDRVAEYHRPSATSSKPSDSRTPVRSGHVIKQLTAAFLESAARLIPGYR